MITGRRPDPMEPRIPDDLPPLASRTIARCLARNPEDRWQSATDLASVLDQLAAGAAQPRAAAERRPIAWVALAAGLILVVAAVIGAMSWTRPAAAPRPLRFTIPPPEGTTFPTVSVGGAPAVAPDGQLIAFVAEGSDGRRLWVRSLEAVDARPLPGTDGAANPAWSSDGRSLTFFAGGSLQRVGLDGQPPRPLTENPVGAGGAAWNDHGQIVWSNGAVLRTIPAGGGEAADVTERDTRLLEENHYAPAFLPDGKHYLVLVRAGADLRYTLCVGELGDPTSRQVLLSGVSSARFAPSASGGPGSLLFVRDGRLLAQPFDADRLAFIGEPHAVADRVATHSFGIIGDFSASANVLAYRVSDPPTQELVWFDRTGRPVGGIGDRPGNRRNNVQLSPDGRSVAFVRETSGVQDVWIADLERGTPARFTFDGGRSPVWSPDGSEIAYLSGDAIVRKPVAGGSEVVVWKGAGILALNDWSGDGRHFLLTRWDPSQGMKGRGLWLLSTGGLNEPPVPTLFEAGGLHGQFAPAAGPPRWVAYDGAGTWVRQMPGSGDGKWQVAERSNAVRWRPDGRELFFIRLLDFVSVQVEDGKGPGFRHSAPQPLFVAPPALRVAMSQYALGYDVAADGQRFLATFPTRETPSAVIDVVLNWQSALADSRTTK
jgi:hypothetical protein